MPHSWQMPERAGAALGTVSLDLETAVFRLSLRRGRHWSSDRLITFDCPVTGIRIDSN
jgi:hypothetical protein